jgi:hypothetical protein
MAFVCVFCKGEDLEPAFNIKIRLEDVESVLCNSKGSFKPVTSGGGIEPHGGFFVTMKDTLHRALQRLEVGEMS